MDVKLARRKTWIQLAIAVCLAAAMPLAFPSLAQAQSPSDRDPAVVIPDQAIPAQPADGPARRQLGNVPDNVGAQLAESDRQVDSLFAVGPLTPLHRIWERASDNLRDSWGLDLGFNYTAVYQGADTVFAGPREGSGGDLDFFGRWQPLACDCCRQGAFVFSSESRHRYGEISPNELNTGTMGGTIVSFGRQDFALVEAYWEQGSPDDGMLARLGKMDPALIYDGGRYVSSNYAFLSPAFSDTLPMPLPGAGLGVAAAIYPSEECYLVAGVHDANGRRTTAGFDTFFGEGEYFTAVEAGLTPNFGQPGAGGYHITFWSVDPRQNAGRASDRGFALTME